MTLEINIRDQVVSQLQSTEPNPAQLNNALRHLSKWRSVLIQNTILKHHGTVVMQGPLKGLDFLQNSAEGCHIAKILGCYEQPLQNHIQLAITIPYEIILNIGCAEGYYAVGMALQMPATKVLAFDLNPKAQEVCVGLAQKNGVSDRVNVGGLFRPEDFATYSKQKTLVFCDIEGGEKELLNPKFASSLIGMDIIVESHECLLPGITQELVDRFKDSHDIEVINDNGQRNLINEPSWFNNLAHLDQLLATWEWRSGPTPWLVMKAR
jgi:hypothetical protein